MKLFKYSISIIAFIFGLQSFAESSISNALLLKSLGLESGDQIVKINGKKLNNIDEVAKLFENMENATELNIEYIRNGKRKTTKINVQDEAKK